MSMRQETLAPYRHRVISAATGCVLEIGIGSGLNARPVARIQPGQQGQIVEVLFGRGIEDFITAESFNSPLFVFRNRYNHYHQSYDGAIE